MAPTMKRERSGGCAWINANKLLLAVALLASLGYLRLLVREASQASGSYAALDTSTARSTQLNLELNAVKEQLEAYRQKLESSTGQSVLDIPSDAKIRSDCIGEQVRAFVKESAECPALAPPEDCQSLYPTKAHPKRQPIKEYLESVQGAQDPFELKIAKMTDSFIGNIMIVVPPLHSNMLGDELRSAFATMTLSIATTGKNVTVLLLGSEAKSKQDWQAMANSDLYIKSRRNVRVMVLPQERAISNLGAASRWSFTVLQWLLIHSRDVPYDTIVFPEYKGLAYYTLVAKKLNLGMATTQIVVNVQSPTSWLPTKLEEVDPRHMEIAFLERKTAEWADVALFSSQHLLTWAENEGWALPEKTFILHNQVRKEKSVPEVAVEVASRSLPIRALTIVLGPEPRRELEYVCDALDRVYARMGDESSRSPIAGRVRALHVRFLQSPSMGSASSPEDDAEGRKAAWYVSAVERRAEHWNLWTHEFLRGDPRDQYRQMLLAHLNKFGAVTNNNNNNNNNHNDVGASSNVSSAATRGAMLGSSLLLFSSFQINTPYSLMETVNSAYPLLAAAVGGVPELLQELKEPESFEDLKRVKPMAQTVLYDPRSSEELVSLLELAIAFGVRVAAPAVHSGENMRMWKKTHDVYVEFSQTQLKAQAKEPRQRATAKPLVSVVLTHTNDRPDLCGLALQSLVNQTYRQLEVVLVDDANSSQESTAFLRKIKNDFLVGGAGRWQVVEVKEPRGVGAARNAGAAAARGEYLMFMDSDSVAKPYHVGALVRAMQSSQVGIVSPFVDIFKGEGQPMNLPTAAPDHGFIGSDSGLGMLRNIYGEANFIIKRSTFQKVGHFSEETDGHEAWKFLTKATLMGVEILPFPSATYWKRQLPGVLPPIRANRLQNLEPYVEAFEKVDPSLRTIIKYLLVQQELFEKVKRQLSRPPPPVVAESRSIEEDRRASTKVAIIRKETERRASSGHSAGVSRSDYSGAAPPGKGANVERHQAIVPAATTLHSQRHSKDDVDADPIFEIEEEGEAPP